MSSKPAFDINGSELSTCLSAIEATLLEVRNEHAAIRPVPPLIGILARIFAPAWLRARVASDGSRIAGIDRELNELQQRQAVVGALLANMEGGHDFDPPAAKDLVSRR